MQSKFPEQSSASDHCLKEMDELGKDNRWEQSSSSSFVKNRCEDQGDASENDKKNADTDSKNIKINSYIKSKGTVTNVTINTLSNIIGGGILSLPLAAYRGSIVVTIFIFLIGSFFAGFAVLVLAYGCEVVQKFNYSDMLLYTLSPAFPLQEGKVFDKEQEALYYQSVSKKERKKHDLLMLVVEFILLMFNFGTLVIYSRVISDSIPPVLSNFLGAEGVWIQRWFWLLLPSILFFIFGCARALHELKWSSLVGFATIFYVVLFVIARFFTNMSSPVIEEEGRHDIRWVEIRVSLLSTISQFSFSVAYHYNVPGFYYELKDRRPYNMLKTSYIAFPIVFFCYASIAVFGYLTFGSVINSKEASGNIMNNFSDSDIPANIGRLGLFFHFVCVYPIVEVATRRNLHRFICLLLGILFHDKNVENNTPTEATTETMGLSNAVATKKEKSTLTSSTTLQIIAPATELKTSPYNKESETLTESKGSISSCKNKEPAISTSPPTTVFKVPPGDPSTTTRRSIIIEAFAIVLFSTLVAAFVPGIGIVVEFLGCLFGISIVFIMPACVGIKVFKQRVVDASTQKIKALAALSWILLVVGIIFMICGLIYFFTEVV